MWWIQASGISFSLFLYSPCWYIHTNLWGLNNIICWHFPSLWVSLISLLGQFTRIFLTVYLNRNLKFVVVVQSLSSVQVFATPWTAAYQASLSFTSSKRLLWFMSIQSVMLPSHFILCCPLLFPSIFPNIGSFPMSQFFVSGGQSIATSASVLQVSIQSWFLFRTDWLDLLEVQMILKSLFQHHNLKVSILQCSTWKMTCQNWYWFLWHHLPTRKCFLFSILHFK